MTPQPRQPQQISQLISGTKEPVFDPQVSPITQPPAEGRDGTFVKNFGKFERAGATYTWHIYIPGRQKLYGFSKPKGMGEKQNKQELLMDCIRRLNQNGYVKERNKIMFFRNFDDSDDKSVMLLTLFGRHYLPEAVILNQTWLVQFLNNFYNPTIQQYGTELFPTGQDTAPPTGRAIIPDKRQQGPPLDPFSEARKFRDSDALMAYGEKLLRDGHAHGLVLDYTRKMLIRITNPQ